MATDTKRTETPDLDDQVESAVDDADSADDDLAKEGWDVADADGDVKGKGDEVEDEDGESSEAEKGLDELEAEELEMLTEDEAAETLVVDEAAEMRAIRLAEIALSSSGEERAEDEFLCQNCFLLKKSSQLADKRRQLCNDCA